MPSTVTITSSRPNNSLVRVLKQVVDADGAPAGEPMTRIVLDDGEEVVVQVSPHEVVILVEQARDAATAAPDSGPSPAPEIEPVPPVIGHGDHEQA